MGTEKHIITVRKVDRFMKAKGMDRECPCCHTSSWTLQTDEDGSHPAAIMLSLDGNFTVPFNYIPMYVTVCDNCGYIRSFSRLVYKKWLEEEDEQ